MDLTVKWEEVVSRRVVIYVPDEATPDEKLAAARKAAGDMIETAGGVVRGTVRYRADDGSFGGSLA